MPIDPPIATLFDDKKPLLSLEFFPPKTDEAEKSLVKTAGEISTAFHPDFVSITYGAGGTTREKTFAYAQWLHDKFEWTVMPHLTCVGHSRDELIAIAESYERLGIRNLMALRGDAPKGAASFTPAPDGLAHASELVALIKNEIPSLCLGVAGYPEKHPEATDLATDVKHLAHKVSQGAHFVTTQLFFDNAAYFNFVAACRACDIRTPIIPGILPVLSLEQAQRFCAFSHTTLPAELARRLAAVPAPDAWRVGVDWAFEQTKELLSRGAPAIHLYIMNRSEPLLALLDKLHTSKLF